MLHHLRKILCFILLLISSNTYGDQESFSEMAASGNDWLIRQSDSRLLFKPFAWAASRTMSITLFPLCAGLDMAVLTTQQAKEVPYLLLANDKNRRLHQEQFRKNKEAMKSTSLGLVTSPFGLLSPDLVTHHFVPFRSEPYTVTPYGKLFSKHADISSPQSIEDVQTIINEAKRRGKSISVLGRGMSQGMQVISKDDWNIIIDTSKLNHIEIDPALKIARVGSGASWKDLQNAANKHRLAVRVMQASNIFTIGGSISANCHGWDHKTGCLRETVLSMTIVDPEGRIVEITSADPLFDYVVGGYGNFGVIVNATLSLTDNINLLETGIEIEPAKYFEYFKEHIQKNEEIEMHLYRLSLEPKKLFKTGIAVNYLKIDAEPVMANLIDEPSKGTRLDRIKIHTLRRLAWIRDFAWRTEKNNTLKDSYGSRNELMRPPINPVFNGSDVDTEWLQEYFVKGENLSDFLSFLSNILQKNNVPLFNASVRYVKQDSRTKLSYAKNSDHFAVVLFFNQKLTAKEIEKTKSWVRDVTDYLIANEGTYYLPYQPFATKDQFRACYSDADQVISFKKAYDPQNLFNTGFFSTYLTCKSEPRSSYHKVFSRVDGQRKEVRDFLDHVFMQLDSDKFFALMDSILDEPDLNDEEIYQKLSENIDKAKPNIASKVSLQLKSLSYLKKDLAEQTAHLVGTKEIRGYVEIGYPGRLTRSLKKQLNIKGPIYTITDNERLTDYIEAGFPRPYDHFVSLENYDPISTDAISDASVDLVCMYIGLHHIPQEKLDAFIASIHRILKPGGYFILMDHNAHTEDLCELASIAHNIFNAATGVSPVENLQEVRNFAPLSYWIKKMEEHNFNLYPHQPLVRQGDSTLNSIIRFEKPVVSLTPDAIVSSLNTYPGYVRPEMQTFLTAPEWQNVRAAQNYSTYIEKNPFYSYPYFTEIAGFWKVYGKSWQAASEQHSFGEVAFSDYNLMNLFVGSSMTIEYGTKGLISAPIKFVSNAFGETPSKEVKSSADIERRRSLKAYGDYIENTPFYQYPYFQDIRSYWKSYVSESASTSSKLKGLLVGMGMTLEYGIKGVVSAPISLIYNSENLKEAETTHLLIVDEDNCIEHIDSRIKVVTTYPEHCIKHIEIPRYMLFTEIMEKISLETSVQCINIAGHNYIQMDIQKSLGGISTPPIGAERLYEIPSPSNPEKLMQAWKVEVSQLCTVIKELKNQNIKLLFIHDY